MCANNRYLNWAETCYKIFYLIFAPNVLLFRKIGGTPFAKSKIQRMSPNFVHCMYLIFEPILLRRKFWCIPLHRNVPVSAWPKSLLQFEFKNHEIGEQIFKKRQRPQYNSNSLNCKKNIIQMIIRTQKLQWVF